MLVKKAPTFPDSDGLPMSDNMKQARWIFRLHGNIAAMYRSDPLVLVAADNLWYPLETDDEVRIGPDVYVVFGRPKGDRGSYKQWEEGGIPLTLVFEIFSPGNTWREMMDKLAFYEDHGVEEFYIYDPDRNDLAVFVRGRMGGALVRQRFGKSFVSPRLKIRFDLSGDGEMQVFYPNGEPFLSFEELKDLQERESARAVTAESRAVTAENRAVTAENRAATAEQRLARLIELVRCVRQGTASPEEVEELERLENAI